MLDFKWSCGHHGYKKATKKECLYLMAIMGQKYGKPDEVKRAVKVIVSWP